MKSRYRGIYIHFVLYFLCNTLFAQGSWIQKADILGTARWEAVGFSIGTKGYIGTGTNGGYLNDFWEWDQVTNTWSQKANFGGLARYGAVGFSIGDKGYIGTGYNNFVFYQDFWEYDTLANSWTQKAPFSGASRAFAVGFSIGTKGYIGTGSTTYSGTAQQDFWEYDPADPVNGMDVNGNPMGAWVQKAPFAGAARWGAVGFSNVMKGYIGTGLAGSNQQDFWEYDPTDPINGLDANGNPMGAWVEKMPFGGTARQYATGFSIYTKGYLGTGYDISGARNDFWQYDPDDISNGVDVNGNPKGKWSQKANFGGTSRGQDIGFSIGCKGYIGTSSNTSQDDFWEYNPVDILISSQNVLCNGQCTGTGTVTPSGGANPYTYLWNNTQTTQIATGLCVGNYVCIVTDSLGCSNSDSIVITEPDTLMISLLSQVSVDCNGNSTGSAAISVSGGISPYTYLWSSVPIQSTSTASNLLAGNYTITVTDSNACISTDTVTIVQPDSIAITIISTNVTCNGNTDGSLTANVAGGITPYAYSWSSGGTGATENNLSAATYTVTVTDSNNCSAVQTGVIEEPAVLAVSLASINNVSCNGGNNGSATVGVTGGTAPYTYSWSSGGTAAVENNLSFGTYTITVTDSNNCTGTQTVSITEPGALVIDSMVTNVSCNGGSNGSAMAMVLGGTIPYGYSWSSGGTAVTENSLSSGTYTLTVTDSNNCIATDTVLVSEPLLLTVDIVSSVDVTCNGGNNGSATAGANGGVAPYIYSWSSGSTTALANNLSAESYTITVTDSNSCVSIDSITIQEPLPLGITLSSSPTVCSGSTGTATTAVTGGTSPYTYLWSSGGTVAIEDSLSAGTYTITITDANGCTQNGSGTITSTNPLTLSVSSTPTACDTSTGVATAVPANGTQPYLYSWSTNPVQDSATAFGLAAGNYTVTVTDSNGCTQSQSLNIATLSGPTAALAASVTNITLGGSAQLLAVGGTTYAWTPLAGLSCTDCQNPVATPVETTTYCVTLSDTSNCTDSACITITVETPCGKIEVPTAFSPNNDGHNDLFVLQGFEKCVLTFSFMIFDRWGEKVFETKSLSSLSWDGTFKGKPLNPAVFVYYIDATFIGGERINKKGNVSLIR